MLILEEIDFYEKYLSLKDAKGFGWKTYGSLLQMSDAAIRMAFKNKSLKDYEIEIIENNFDVTKEQKTAPSSKNLISLDESLLSRPQELDLLCRFIAKFKPELENDAIFKKIIKEIRLEGENKLLQEMIEALQGDNSKVAQNIKEFLLTRKVPSEK